jgi:preprotein translocase subunit SecD
VGGWESVPGPGPGGHIWISPEVTLTNDDVAQARPGKMEMEVPSVHLQLTQDGAIKLARLSKAHIGEMVALMIDGRVMSAPQIMDEIIGGQAMMVGDFTSEEAKSIAECIVAE